MSVCLCLSVFLSVSRSVVIFLKIILPEKNYILQTGKISYLEGLYDLS